MWVLCPKYKPHSKYSIKFCFGVEKVFAKQLGKFLTWTQYVSGNTSCNGVYARRPNFHRQLWSLICRHKITLDRKAQSCNAPKRDYATVDLILKTFFLVLPTLQRKSLEWDLFATCFHQISLSLLMPMPHKLQTLIIKGELECSYRFYKHGMKVNTLVLSIEFFNLFASLIGI